MTNEEISQEATITKRNFLTNDEIDLKRKPINIQIARGHPIDFVQNHTE